MQVDRASPVGELATSLPGALRVFARLVGTLARATATLALASSKRADQRVGAMVLPSWVVSERASITATLSAMRDGGAQELMVLGEDRALVGVLRDIDALRLEARLAGSAPGIQLAG